MWSVTLRWFYGILVVITLGVIAYRVLEELSQKGVYIHDSSTRFLQSSF
jgi:hypothetical protein